MSKEDENFYRLNLVLSIEDLVIYGGSNPIKRPLAGSREPRTLCQRTQPGKS